MSRMENVTRMFEFDAAHRLLFHDGKCKHLHGHRYTVEIDLLGDSDNSKGMVVDFGIVKKTIGEWIDANLDHNILLNPSDPLCELFFHPHNETAYRLKFQKPFIMPDRGVGEPTAENLAWAIADMTITLMPETSGVSVNGVTVWETPNCKASIWLSDSL